MKQNTQRTRAKIGASTEPIARPSIRTHFGKYRDQNLLKALSEEKKAERER